MNAANRPQQRGVAALSTSLVLLLAMTMAGLFAQRSVVAGLRSGANQVRAADAFERAETALAWAVEQLNDPHDLAAAPSCAREAGSMQRLRDRPLPWTAACRQPNEGGAANCRCGTDAGAGVPSQDPGFIVQARAVPGAADSIELLAFGCSQLADCADPDRHNPMQARARHRIVVRTIALLALKPGVAAVSASDVDVQDGVSVTNHDQPGQGVTVMAGGRIALAAHARLDAGAGTPPLATLRERTAALAAWAGDTPDRMVRAILGVTADEYRRDPLTRTLGPADCAGAAACAGLLARETASGVSQFWIQGGIRVDAAMLPAAGTLGTPQRPLVIVTDGDVALGAGVVSHALWVGVGTRLRFTGEAARQQGPVLSYGPMELGGPGLQLHHTPIAPAGRYVKVPGSWRDFDDDASSPKEGA